MKKFVLYPEHTHMVIVPEISVNSEILENTEVMNYFNESNFRHSMNSTYYSANDRGKIISDGHTIDGFYFPDGIIYENLKPVICVNGSNIGGIDAEEIIDLLNIDELDEPMNLILSEVLEEKRKYKKLSDIHKMKHFDDLKIIDEKSCKLDKKNKSRLLVSYTKVSGLLFSEDGKYNSKVDKKLSYKLSKLR